MEKAAIVNYEEMGANAHVALNSMQYDGWILRFSEGHTCRANSVSVIYPSSIDPVEKIAFCEKMYARQDLPCVFKMTDGDEELNELLVKRGYTVVTPTDVMELGLGGVESAGRFGDDSMMLRSDGDATLLGNAGTEIVYFNEPTEEWLTPYFAFEGFNEKKQNIYRRMLDKVCIDTVYAAVNVDGRIVSVASSATQSGRMLIHNVVTDPEQRRKGYARAVCTALLAKAKEDGTENAWLQVVRDNTAAYRLYDSLGFKKLYSYWYMRQS